MSLLTLTHRPAKFADLYGQDAARAILQALVFAADMPPALLFGGPSGTGKTSAARILAAALNCEQPRNGDACTTCSSCTAVRTGTAAAVHEIDAASHGGVEEVRSLAHLAQFATASPWRVILLDEAHAMSRAAFNALLKVLEEPPARTVFVLLTTEPDKILPTVRSRAMPIDFHPIGRDAIARRLTQIVTAEHLDLTPATVSEIADLGEGALRNAVMLLDQARRVGVTTPEDLHRLVGRSDLPPKIMAAIVNHDHAAARALLATYLTTAADLAGLIADLIADLQHRFATHTVSHARMVAATKLLWDARSIPTSPARVARSQTEALLTLLYAVFSDPTASKSNANAPIPRVIPSPPTPPPVENGSRRLELDELVDLLSSE